jgi:hypothetical protein
LYFQAFFINTKKLGMTFYQSLPEIYADLGWMPLRATTSVGAFAL